MNLGDRCDEILRLIDETLGDLRGPVVGHTHTAEHRQAAAGHDDTGRDPAGDDPAEHDPGAHDRGRTTLGDPTTTRFGRRRWAWKRARLAAPADPAELA